MNQTDPGVIVGVYASAPPAPQRDPQVEGELLARLAEAPGVRGLEIPGRGSPFPYDTQWYADHTPDHWELVVTNVGSTMQQLQANAGYGLAAEDPEGRALALADVAQLRDDVRGLNDALGRRAVIAVELHSAPATTGATSSAAALAESLRQIAAWDWDGAVPLLEHCDQKHPGREAAKGFLSLEAELEALTLSETGIGLALNWGRSAIELRDADLVATSHVVRAREAGALRAMVFSGASDIATPYGEPWADTHQPFTPAAGSEIGNPGSLLDDARAQDSIAAAGHLDWLGLKFSCRPPTATIEDRLALIDDGVERVIAAARSVAQEG